MATIRSLGLHEPSALSYLVNEGILPPDPLSNTYKWNSYQVQGADSLSYDEEVLVAGSCVVWSHGAVVKRVFNLGIEDEPIVHAFATWFPSSSQFKNSEKDSESSGDPKRDRALVVCLKSQAHIFLLSGNTHVLPLSFDVERALPCASGFLLQRGPDRKTSGNHKLEPSRHSNLDNKRVSPESRTSRPSLVLPTTDLEGLQQEKRRLPRTYSCTDLLSELGVVVATESKKWQDFDHCRTLSIDESLIYVSSDNELRVNSQTPLCVAVTVNAVNQTLTVWQAALRSQAGSHARGVNGKAAGPKRPPRRKTSDVHGRKHRASTPIPHGPATFRESFGGLVQGQGQSVPSSTLLEQASFPNDDFATQMSRDFGEVGVQTRSARRVSSMLARTDIGAGLDRSTFKDIATGHGGRRSTARSRREGSTGSFTERQSLGQRRSSFNANLSTISTGTSFLGVPGKPVIDEALLELDNTTTHDFDSDTSDLARDFGFCKIKTFAYNTSSLQKGFESTMRTFSLLSPEYSTEDGSSAKNLGLAILSKQSEDMVMVNLVVDLSHNMKQSRTVPQIKATEIRRGIGIADACTLTDGMSQRLLLLTKSQVGLSSLHLEAPWSPSFSLKSPSAYVVFNPFSSFSSESPSRRRETGLRRLIKDSHVSVNGLSRSLTDKQVILVDDGMRDHLVHIDLLPKDPRVLQILEVVNFVLPPNLQDSMLVAWWEVSRWLHERQEWTDEWSAMVVAVFTLAVPFTAGIHNQAPTTPRRRKAGLFRSSSGPHFDSSNWDTMSEDTKTMCPEEWSYNIAWSWMTEERQAEADIVSPTKHSRMRNADSVGSLSTSVRSPYPARYAALAREYIQAPAGEAAFGTNGYLPIAVNKPNQIRRTTVANILVALHLLHEEGKLVTSIPEVSASSYQNLCVVIVQLGFWMSWSSWTWEAGKYYEDEIIGPAQWTFDETRMEGLKVPAQPFEPPSIYSQFERFLFTSESSSFPSLLDLVGGNVDAKSSQWQAAARLTPHTFALLGLMQNVGSTLRGSRVFLDWLSKSGVPAWGLRSFPSSVISIIDRAICSHRKSSGSIHKTLLSNEATSIVTSREYHESHPVRPHIQPSHDAVRDFHTIGVSALETDGIQRWDASAELDRQVVTRLIFSEDRRFQEASKLLNQTRPPTVEYSAESEWTEADLLEAQKELAQYVTRRTLSLALGRGMMHFDARVPLLTERVPIPAFSLQCVMKPQRDNDNAQPMTFSADKAVFTEDKVCWAFFHNGASSGLMISKEAKCIETSWILYNKPAELTNRHAGFLLALGLNGHLRTLAKWVAFKYLTPKHTMTSIGLLLGLSASYSGTMDTSITRLLSVHVTRLLPPGAAELNLSPLTQTSGIMGIGLLYRQSQHRRMSEVMLSELENNESEEADTDGEILRSEGYRLAAGFSLGLINLGQGGKLHALHDMGVLERLLSIAIGTKNVNLVHVLDRATAGAVMAVAMIYLKTNDEAVAKKIDIPDTIHQFDYVRPDVFLLRTLARHLILWDRIQATGEFVSHSLPAVYRTRSNLQGTKHLCTDDLPFFNIIAGICFAISLRYAGSQNVQARDLVIHYLDQFLRLSRLPALNYDSKVTMKSVRSCLDVLALSSATIMAGSGDLVVMRRLRALHGRTDKETPYGSHLAAHMGLGALYMAGGTSTFGTNNVAIAALLISFYPLFPSDVLDNRAHLQALRHLWVLAVEHRCLIARDHEDGTVLSDISATICLKSGEKRDIKLPSLLPELSEVEAITCFSEEHWDLNLNFVADSDLHTKIRSERGLNVYMSRRASYHRPSRDILKTELQALDQAARIPNVNSTRSTTTMQNGEGNPFEWIFNLESLRDLDHSERALVLDDSAVTQGAKLLRSTVVDERLELEHGTLPSEKEGNLPKKVERDRLWQLRLLFAFMEKFERDKEEHSADHDYDNDDDKSGAGWLRKEVVENLKARVWRMCSQDRDAVAAESGLG